MPKPTSAISPTSALAKMPLTYDDAVVAAPTYFAMAGSRGFSLKLFFQLLVIAKLLYGRGRANDSRGFSPIMVWSYQPQRKNSIWETERVRKT